MKRAIGRGASAEMPPLQKGRRGSALSLVVIVSVIVTGLILTLASSAGLQASSASDRTKSDEALYAAEGAMQWALYQLRQNPAWRPSGTSPVVNGWTCAVSCTDLGTPTGVVGNPLKFSVSATKSGTVSTARISATVQGALAYVPQFWSMGNLSIAQSVTMAGDIQTMGNLTVNPPTSGVVLTKGVKGTVKAKGTVTDNNPGALGSGKYFTTAPVGNATDVSSPSMKAADIFNTLKNGSTTPLSSCLIYISGKPVIDFSKAGGKPIYYSGSADYIGGVGIINSSNPSQDTFIVDANDGTVNFTGTFPFNQAVATMNLVLNGNVNFNGSGTTGISITGSFYVTGNWLQAGVYNFKGTVMTDKVTTLAGTGKVDIQAPPAFDPRYVPRVTSYVGNLP
jgi:Tfp pilus assembly protein PilX